MQDMQGCFVFWNWLSLLLFGTTEYLCLTFHFLETINKKYLLSTFWSMI